MSSFCEDSTAIGLLVSFPYPGLGGGGVRVVSCPDVHAPPPGGPGGRERLGTRLGLWLGVVWAGAGPGYPIPVRARRPSTLHHDYITHGNPQCKIISVSVGNARRTKLRDSSSFQDE